MSTAAQQPRLTVVPPMPTAPPAPLEGVIAGPTNAAIEKTGRPNWLGSAINHVKANQGHLPTVGRGYRRLGALWVDRYYDDWPLMIATVRNEIKAADDSAEQKEKKKLVRKHRKAYRKHRLIHVGITAGWGVAGGTGLAVGTLTGGLAVDLGIALGAYLIGLWQGVGEGPAAIGSQRQLDTTVPQTAAVPGPASEEALLTALVKADIITPAEREETRIVGGIRQDGPGWSATIELPEGVPAIKATAKVSNLAGALRKKASQIEFKPDSSENGHEGMVTLWAGDQPNPFAGPKVYSSLINAPSWRFWQDGIPLGTDARQARQTLNLIWSSILIGGLQDYGKTYLARLIAAAAALDPTVRIIVITGKKSPDWSPLKRIAHRYIAGSDPDVIREIFATMNTVIDDMQARGDELDQLFDKEPHRVPEGKITPELAAAGMGPVLVLVEELQELLGGAAVTKMPLPDDDSENPRLVSAKPLLVDLFGRFNRAARFVLGMGVYITQRPDSGSVPTELREVCVKRASFRTKSRESSEMILGDMAVAAGASPHALLESSKGVFVLEEGAEDGYRTLRGDVIDLPDFAAICERGRQLRIEKGALSGDAADREERAQRAIQARAVIAEALAVMDQRQVDRIRTETLAAAMGLTADQLKAKMRAAGVPDHTGIGAVEGLQNPRGYKRDMLVSV
jgi:S-DNA-T family DNA segregation ATPase FtsK/SpoIIIE